MKLARVKINSPTYELAELIIQTIEDRFGEMDTETSPIIPSERGGFHSFVNIKDTTELMK